MKETLEETYEQSVKRHKDNKTMIHLHCHNTHSELDGFGTPEQHMERCKELNLSHMAITNHNHLGGILEFQDACNKSNVKPILGCELYYTSDTETLALDKKDRDQIAIDLAESNGIEIPKKITKKELNAIIEPFSYDTKQYHILFLAKNQNGWKNLVKLQSEAAVKCTFNGRFLVDNELMKKYKEDLICTTACIGSKPSSLISKGLLSEAEELIDSWHEIYGDDFYLEIQPLNINKQIMTNELYMKWAKEKGIKLVATNDVHYPKKEDNEAHDVLLCIGLKREISDSNRMRYDHEYWIRSYDEMLEAFERQLEGIKITDKEEYMNNVMDAMANTGVIADQIEDVKLGSSVPLFPDVKLEHGMTEDETLEYRSFSKLYKYAKDKNMDEENLQKHEERLRTELDVIKKKNYSPYFIAVEDYIEKANARGCSTGPSRGSAAGSFASFINGIVKVTDPMDYDLLFFRFLTEDRVSPPDYLYI